MCWHLSSCFSAGSLKGMDNSCRERERERENIMYIETSFLALMFSFQGRASYLSRCGTDLGKRVLSRVGESRWHGCNCDSFGRAKLADLVCQHTTLAPGGLFQVTPGSFKRAQTLIRIASRKSPYCASSCPCHLQSVFSVPGMPNDRQFTRPNGLLMSTLSCTQGSKYMLHMLAQHVALTSCC